MSFSKLFIKDACSIGDGAHASIARAETGVPYLTAKNFTKEGISLNEVDFISELDYSKHFRENSKAVTKPKKSDLIFSIIGSLGGAYLYKESDRFGISSSVAIIRPDQNKIDALYLLHYLKSEFLQKSVELMKSGSAQGFLSLEMIRGLPLILPPLPIQRKIASILSAYDDLIENNKQRIKLLEEMAEEIYKEWFVRFRFPGYESTRFFDEKGKEVSYGTSVALPEGWENGKLGDLVMIRKGQNITADTVIEGNIPVVAGGLQPAYFHNASNAMAPCITVSASGANAGFVNIYHQDIWASDCSVIDSNSTDTVYYFYLTLKTRQIEVTNLQKGSAQPHVYPKDLLGLSLKKPKWDLVSKFENIIAPFFKEVAILNEKNQLLQQTRDLLLPRLISGKLSVENLIKEEGESFAMAAESDLTYG